MFHQKFIDLKETRLSLHTGGSGAPLLMIHGYPQTHAAWGKVAPNFAKHFQCVIPDLRGYGESSVPASGAGHQGYSKRTMARELVELMAALGHDKFSVLGHDRGARVAYRMALDFPNVVTRLGIVDVVPTADVWSSMDAELAKNIYHWTFLAQPDPLPEKMIAADPVAYLEWTLKSWSKHGTLDCFTDNALESYRTQMLNEKRIHALCEDYRAGATIDRETDEADKKAGRKIKAPMFVVWGDDGLTPTYPTMVEVWKNWAMDVNGCAIDCGHFVMEENPKAFTETFLPFLLKT